MSKLKVDVSYFENLLDVSFRQTTSNTWRAKEHSSWALRIVDGEFLFSCYNGDYTKPNGKVTFNAFEITKAVHPHLSNAEIFERLAQKFQRRTPTKTEKKEKESDPNAPQKVASFHVSNNNEATLRTFQYFKEKVNMSNVEQLQAFEIKTIKDYGKIKSENFAYPFFAYCDAESVKLKEPKQRIFKNKVTLKTDIKKYQFGLSYLNTINNELAKSKYVVVTEGEDDALAININCKNIAAITFGGVTNQFNSLIINELKEKFAGVFIGFDNDAAGIKNAPLHAKKHDLPYFFCPMLIPKSKDFCDLLKDVNYDNKYFEHLLARIIERAHPPTNTTNAPIPKKTSNLGEILPTHLVMSRQEAKEKIALNNNIVITETQYFENLKDVKTRLFTYRQISEVVNICQATLDCTNQKHNVYIFVSEYINTINAVRSVNEIIKLNNYANIFLISENDFALPFKCKKSILSNRPNTNFSVIVCDDLDTSFVQYVRANNSSYLETSLSVSNILGDEKKISKKDFSCINRTELDICVKYDENVTFLPSYFEGCRSVKFFIKKGIENFDLKKFQDFQTEKALQIADIITDDPSFKYEYDLCKTYSKLKYKLIFSFDTKKWEIDKVHKLAQDNDYQVKIYANNYKLLASFLGVEVMFFEATTPQDEIHNEIEKMKQELKDEKKKEFDNFFTEIESKEIKDFNGIIKLVGEKSNIKINNEFEFDKIEITSLNLNRGEKIALERLKTISKHANFSVSMEIVRDNYFHFSRFLGRIKTANILKLPDEKDGKVGKLTSNIKTFFNTFSSDYHTKDSLIQNFIDMGLCVVRENAWKEISSCFFILRKKQRLNKKSVWVYCIDTLE